MSPKVLLFLLLVAPLTLFASAAHPTEEQIDRLSTKPNIVVILADDMGWRDVGYHGSEIHTPNLDRIAMQGIELDRFYVQPMCSPTRSALMTGKSPMRLGITLAIGKNETTGLSLDETILPQHLGRLGYQSLMVGKWHLGHYTPDLFPHARGFEHFYGNLTGGVGYWDHNHGGGHDWQRNGVTVREEGYATRLVTDEALGLLANRDRSRPTFLYVAFGAPHLPNEAPEETVAKYADLKNSSRRVHAAMVDELDQGIGQIVTALVDENMLDNTIIFFSSDNGGLIPATSGIASVARFLTSVFDRPVPTAGLEFAVSNLLDGASDNAPLLDGKASVAEGGIRVPAAIWWPGRLEGLKHSKFMSITDVLPTLLEAIGEVQAVPDNLDGRSQWSALRGGSESETPDYVVSGLYGAAIFRPPWKLVIDDPSRLYNVFEDPGETTDLAIENAALVSELSARFESWPRRERESSSMLDVLRDPDTFGGAEDREPWADVARDRARN